MNKLKPFLVDVPVRVNVWIRPECQRKQFEVLKQARPSIMFLISDGGRNEKEWEALRKNRAMFENEIDWECTIYKIFEKKNNGLYTMSRRGAELIWSTVDKCIFLEDDCVPSVSYFKFCEELLEKYKNDTRILCICSMNHAGVWEKSTSDYFFSERGPIVGQAMWKRNYEERDFNFEYGKDPYVMELLKQRTKNDPEFFAKIEGYANNPHHCGHMPGGEFFGRLGVYSQNQLYIVPKYNMMCNIGCTEDAEHASEYKLLPHAIRKIFNMKTYEYEFPLKHPKYVIADAGYRKYQEKTLAADSKVRRFLRKIETTILFFRYKGLKGVYKKISRHFNKRIEN